MAGFWKYLGIGYYQAWVFLVVMGLAVVPDNQEVVDETWLRMALSGMLALALVVGMFVEHHLDILRNGRWVLSLSGCMAAAGTLCVSEALAVYQSATLCFLGVVFISIGNSVVLLAWIEHLSCVPQSEQLRYTLTAWPTAAVAVPLLSLMPARALIVVASLLPLASAVTVIGCSRQTGADRRESQFGPEGGTAWKKSLTRLLIACLAVSFAFGCARTIRTVTDVMADQPLVYLAVAVVFVVVLALSRAGVGGSELAVRVYRLCFPVLILSYLALPFLSQWAAAVDVCALMSASYLFEMLVWLVCPFVVVERGLASLQLFGWGAAAFHVGSFAGLLFGDWAQGRFGADALATPLCIGIAGVLVVVTCYVFREQGVSDLFLPARDVPPEAAPDQVHANCCELAEEFGLTSRERQVLELLARGRSAPYIEQELGVSASTAKTHVRHIYDKLGVHNKQELLDLFA